jgi:hypothetical protein
MACRKWNFPARRYVVGGMHTFAWLRLAVLAGGTAGVALLAGCTLAAQHAGATPPAPRASSSQPAPPSATGLLPASPSLTDRLVLSSTQVRAGARIPATIVVTNRGQAPVRLADSHGCRPAYAVALTNGRFPPNVSFGADCGRAPLVLAPGVTRLKATVITTYQGCTPTKAQATRNFPECLPGKHPLLPPLPAGRYRVVLVGENLALPAPAAVPVQLTPAPHRA